MGDASTTSWADRHGFIVVQPQRGQVPAGAEPVPSDAGGGVDRIAEGAQFGIRFEVHEPPELIEHIRELSARLVAAVPPSS